jgi:hypothetical protein
MNKKEGQLDSASSPLNLYLAAKLAIEWILGPALNFFKAVKRQGRISPFSFEIFLKFPSLQNSFALSNT